MISLQLMRFGVVGVLAMCVHLLVVALLVPLGLVPLLANIVGFLVAFQVSYFGHARWTFNVSAPNNKRHQIKFFSVAVLGFLLNEASYSVLLQLLHMHYLLTLAIVLFGVAVVTFVLSKLWAFRE